MSIQFEQSDSIRQLPDLAAVGFRPTHYASSQELKALYSDECQRCGMCCIFYAFRPFSMPIAAQGSQPPRKFIQIGKRHSQYTRDEAIAFSRGESKVGQEMNAYLRIKPDRIWKGHNRCAALEGIQGVKVSCRIYSERPYACSDFDPGSPNCLNIRKWAGIDPIDDGYGRS